MSLGLPKVHVHAPQLPLGVHHAHVVLAATQLRDVKQLIRYLNPLLKVPTLHFVIRRYRTHIPR